MLNQIKTFKNNVLAFEVIDSFTMEDEKLGRKWFDEKLKQGFTQVNILVKIDEMKVSKSSTKAFFEDILWTLRHYKNLGHLAIVAHSKILKVLIPIDNLFFERAKEGKQERYFDSSQMDEAIAFVNL